MEKTIKELEKQLRSPKKKPKEILAQPIKKPERPRPVELTPEQVE